MPAGVPTKTFTHGSKTVGTSVIVLSATSIKTKSGVLIKAAAGNAGKVYPGSIPTVTADSDDATDGFELSAGDSVEVEVDNVSNIHLIASEANQKVFWIGV